MRIERRKLGVQVRVILNRTEATQAALAAIAVTRKLEGSHSPRSTTVYIGGIGRGEGDLHADPGEFEKQCRIIAERQIVIPIEASFRVGLDDTGAVCGATFQFYDLHETV